MKKIINGKVYDTSTAKHIGWWDNGLGVRDFGYFREDLYRKKTGEYFLDGEGGPASKYSKSIGNNSWSGDEKLIPLDFEAAKEWAEKHLSADEYEAEFGEIIEDESKRTVAYSLSNTAIDTAKRKATEAGTSVSEFIEKLIMEV